MKQPNFCNADNGEETAEKMEHNCPLFVVSGYFSYVIGF